MWGAGRPLGACTSGAAVRPCSGQAATSGSSNASDRSYYQWHEYCVRFWMNVNFKDALDGVTWEQRLSSVLWLALTALALGDNVLIHCRQGKHRSGILAMLLMSILARPGSEDWIWHSLLTPNQQ